MLADMGKYADDVRPRNAGPGPRISSPCLLACRSVSEFMNALEMGAHQPIYTELETSTRTDFGGDPGISPLAVNLACLHVQATHVASRLPL